MRLCNARLNGSFVLMLRTPSEPGVRVKKELYKPGQNQGSITLTNYLYILDDLPCTLLSLLRHHLVSSSYYYVTTSCPLLTTTSLPRVLLSLLRHKNEDEPLQGWEAPAITVAREETAQQTGTATLSMQVNPQALPSSDVSVPFMIPSLSAPLLKLRSSSTKGRFCTPLKDPG